MLLGLPLPVRHQPLKGDFGGIRNTADYLGSFDGLGISITSAGLFLSSSAVTEMFNLYRLPMRFTMTWLRAPAGGFGLSGSATDRF